MRNRSLAPLLSSIVAVGSLGLAACGGDDSSPAATVPADVDLTVVALDGIRWEQESYSATAGTITVALRNDSSLPHNLHFIAEDGADNVVTLETPSRGNVDVDDVELAAGTYTMICTIPGHSNMKATLTVG